MLSANSLPKSMMGQFLGSGCFGKVFDAGHGRVIKIAYNDMARNWLEFCVHRRITGGDMTFVPVVHIVVNYVNEYGEGERCLAVMDKYEPQRSIVLYDMYSNNPPSDLEGYDCLKKDFMKYMVERGYYGDCVFNDLHSNNIMVDPSRNGNKLVFTDPSTGEYLVASPVYGVSKDLLW